MNFTWFATSFDTDDWLYRVLTIVQMGGVLVLASGVRPAFVDHDFRVIVLAYVVMRLALVAQWLRASRGAGSARRTALVYAGGICVVQVLWLASLLVPTDLFTPVFFVLVLAELAVPVVAAHHPEDFNATNDENGSFDDRSDNKGPEPEGVTVGAIGEQRYAFVGLERDSGIAVVDVTDPASAGVVGYATNRDFSGDAEAGTAGDLGPECLHFIAAEDSPSGEPPLIVGNEVSGTTTIWQVEAPGA